MMIPMEMDTATRRGCTWAGGHDCRISEGRGIAGRMSNSVLYFKQNRPPNDLDLSNTIVFTNRDLLTARWHLDP